MALRIQAAAREALADAFLARYGGRSECLDPPGIMLRAAVELEGARDLYVRPAPAPSARDLVDAPLNAEASATVSTSLDLLRRLRAFSPDARSQLLLRNARLAGGIPYVDPAWLTYSPFGWHASIFLAMARDPSLPFGDARSALDIACYGSGWHDHADMMRADSMHHGMPAEEAVASVASYRALQVLAFGPDAGTSYEARDLLAAFLSGGGAPVPSLYSIMIRG